VKLRVYAPQNWQLLGYDWPVFVDSLRNFGFWFSSCGSTSNLFLLGQLPTRWGPLWSLIAAVAIPVVAARGGSYPRRFTLSISLYLCLISWCCRRLLGFGLFNFQQQLMWQARVPIFGTPNVDGLRILNCYNPRLCLSLKWVERHKKIHPHT